MTKKLEQKCRLYLITPPQIQIPHFLGQFKNACDGGDIAVLQLRLKNGNKTSPDDEILRAAEALKPICNERGISFIINDKAELAKKSGADGVHIGEDQDGTIKDAREILGNNKIIGYSCYASRHRAMCAGEDGADYIAFGSFYPTQTKEPKGRPTPDILEWWSTYTIMPCVAIGGIKPDNLAPLVKAGADFIAVVTGVWNHQDGPKQAVKIYNEKIRKAENDMGK